ncbi:MAG: hypothetical protein ABI488_12750 [Polyangiaceae bacterium]
MSKIPSQAVSMWPSRHVRRYGLTGLFAALIVVACGDSGTGHVAGGAGEHPGGAAGGTNQDDSLSGGGNASPFSAPPDGGSSGEDANREDDGGGVSGASGVSGTLSDGGIFATGGDSRETTGGSTAIGGTTAGGSTTIGGTTAGGSTTIGGTTAGGSTGSGGELTTGGVSGNSQGGDCSSTWLHVYDGGDGGRYLSTLALDSHEDMLLAGWFENSIRFDDIVVSTHTKTDPSTFDSDVYVAKVDRCGRVLWAIGAGDTATQYAVSLAVDTTDDVVITGSFAGTLDFGIPLSSSGDDDAFVAKFDSSGHLRWVSGFGGPGSQAGISIAVDAAHNLIVGGRFYDQTTVGTSQVYCAISPFGPLPSIPPHKCAFVTKMDPDGNAMWRWNLGPEDSSGEIALALDPQGNVLVASFLSSPGTLFGAESQSIALDRGINIIKFDPQGNVLWVKRLAADSAAGPSIVVDSRGYVTIAGQYLNAIDLGAGGFPTVQQGRDAYIASFNSLGTLQWSQHFGDGMTFSSMHASFTDLENHIFFSGSVGLPLDLGAGTALKASAPFLADFTASGACVRTAQFDLPGANANSSGVTALLADGSLVARGIGGWAYANFLLGVVPATVWAP